MWRGEIEVIRVNVAAGRHQSFGSARECAPSSEGGSKSSEGGSKERRDGNYQRCASRAGNAHRIGRGHGERSTRTAKAIAVLRRG